MGKLHLIEHLQYLVAQGIVSDGGNNCAAPAELTDVIGKVGRCSAQLTSFRQAVLKCLANALGDCIFHHFPSFLPNIEKWT